MMMRIQYQYKVAIFFYMLIAVQKQPEFKQDDHNHDHHQKHPHDHDHDHHRRSRIRKASRIYNGVRTPSGQAKFMAVMVKSPRDNYCSAVIITERMLLTAAHCFDDLSAADRAMMRILPNAIPSHQYNVLPLLYYRNSPHGNFPFYKKIENFWIHPRYKPNHTDQIYDIALVQIGPQPFQLGREVDTALMPVRVRQLDFRVIKGYGFGRIVGEISPSHLNEVDFRYYWNETHCQRMFEYQKSNRDHDVNFCVTNWSPDRALNPTIIRNTGPGDSGGGILIKGSVRRLDRSTGRNIIKTGWVLAGISSKSDNYTESIANLRSPYGTLAVNVTTMMPWINSIVRVNFETYKYPKSTSRM